eukprot:4041665-Prymnesium_polylepis.1
MYSHLLSSVACRLAVGERSELARQQVIQCSVTLHFGLTADGSVSGPACLVPIMVHVGRSAHEAPETIKTSPTSNRYHRNGKWRTGVKDVVGLCRRSG